MKNWRTIGLVAGTILLFWYLKFYFGVPSADVGVVGIILTISSILFGLLAGFFISELWTRYTEIRELQGRRSAAGLTMIEYAEHFYKNKKFKEKFQRSMEKTAIVDEIIEWDEGHLEIPYYKDVADSFELIDVKNAKDEQYLQIIINKHNDYVESIVRLDALYKDRLFISEWLILLVLSLIISVSVLFLDVTHPLYKVVTLAFPAVITLAISLIYDLDRLAWSFELITLEPIQRILKAIGAKRFYLSTRNYPFLESMKDYRTEKDLGGDLKELYNGILKQRKQEKYIRRKDVPFWSR